MLLYISTLLFSNVLAAQDTTNLKNFAIDKVPSLPNDTSFSKITSLKNRYCIVDENNAKRIEKLGFNRTLFMVNEFSSLKNIPDLKTVVGKTKTNVRRQKSFAIAGIPCFASGVFVLVISFMSSTAIGPNGNDDFAAKGATLGFASIATALSFEVISIVNGIKKKKHLNKAVAIYNEKL